MIKESYDLFDIVKTMVRKVNFACNIGLLNDGN